MKTARHEVRCTMTRPSLLDDGSVVLGPLRRGVGGVDRIFLVHHFHRLIGRVRSGIHGRRRIVRSRIVD
jgi:hypothetical protein